MITHMLCNKSVILSDIVIDNIFNFYMKILLSEILHTNELEILILYTKIIRTWFIVISEHIYLVNELT